MDKPLVTVLMPVFNGLPYLRGSINSIIGQSFHDFEFIIVDDASTDGSSLYLKQMAKQDSRIRIIRNPENRGVTMSLNRGLREARGAFVARMDADDVSERHRLEDQVAFLRSNDNHVAVGSSCIVIDENGNEMYRELIGCNHIEMMLWFLKQNHMVHGSVLFRRLDGIQYNESLVCAQDYDLWVRLAQEGKLANIQACLYRLRKHKNTVTAVRSSEQARNARIISDRHAHHIYDAGQISMLLNGYLYFGGDSQTAERLAKLLRLYLSEKTLTREERRQFIPVLSIPRIFMKRHAVDTILLKQFTGPCYLFLWLLCRRLGTTGCHVFGKTLRLAGVRPNTLEISMAG